MARSIAILANGPSLRELHTRDLLRKIPCETFGVNASWRYQRASYHLMIDEAQWQAYQQEEHARPFDSMIVPRNTKWGGEVDGSYAKERHWTRLLDADWPKWSWYPFHFGVYAYKNVTYAAIQLAIGMGYTSLYFIGLDLYNEDGSDYIHSARQREAFGFAAGILRPSGIRLINCNSRSRCHAFKRMDFDRAFDL